MLDHGEVLLDSNAIVDYLDEVHGHELRLIPTSGADRRAVLKLAAIAMGACEKGLQAAYERNHHPPDKLHQPWIDDCLGQVANALSYIEEQIVPGQAYLLLGRLTQADISVFVAERLGHALGIETGTKMPRLRDLTSSLAGQPPFVLDGALKVFNASPSGLRDAVIHCFAEFGSLLQSLERHGFVRGSCRF